MAKKICTVIRADYFSYQVKHLTHEEMLAKVIEINKQIQDKIKKAGGLRRWLDGQLRRRAFS